MSLRPDRISTLIHLKTSTYAQVYVRSRASTANRPKARLTHTYLDYNYSSLSRRVWAGRARQNVSHLSHTHSCVRPTDTLLLSAAGGAPTMPWDGKGLGTLLESAAQRHHHRVWRSAPCHRFCDGRNPTARKGGRPNPIEREAVHKHPDWPQGVSIQVIVCWRFVAGGCRGQFSCVCHSQRSPQCMEELEAGGVLSENTV